MKILLHICCSNCSIYPVRVLRSEKHDIAGFWFNPNIHPYEEYDLRLDSLKRLAGEWKFEVLNTEDYSPEEYFQMFNLSDDVLIDKTGSSSSNGLSSLNVPPSPERCRSCYQLRLEKTAEHAQKEGFNAFSTTLLISPYQDFEQIVSTGKELADKYNVQFHSRDYRPYFGEAMAYAKELGLYRQKYCGCIFSREERNMKKEVVRSQ
jgi:predicted adenine nucleotide alpha hydrolase (AANH) superfamily ATPase